jgi:hypothetical protein
MAKAGDETVNPVTGHRIVLGRLPKIQTANCCRWSGSTGQVGRQARYVSTLSRRSASWSSPAP